jgi:hypothetical protein
LNAPCIAPRAVLGYPLKMSHAPPCLAKLFSAGQCPRYLSLGWSVKHEIREAPGAEPYEYILEWARVGNGSGLLRVVLLAAMSSSTPATSVRARASHLECPCRACSVA